MAFVRGKRCLQPRAKIKKGMRQTFIKDPIGSAYAFLGTAAAQFEPNKAGRVAEWVLLLATFESISTEKFGLAEVIS